MMSKLLEIVNKIREADISEKERIGKEIDRREALFIKPMAIISCVILAVVLVAVSEAIYLENYDLVKSILMWFIIPVALVVVGSWIFDKD